MDFTGKDCYYYDKCDCSGICIYYYNGDETDNMYLMKYIEDDKAEFYRDWEIYSKEYD